MSESRTPGTYGEVPSPEDLEDGAGKPDRYGEVAGDGERATTNDAEGEYGEVPGAGGSGTEWRPEGVDAAGLHNAEAEGVDLHPETTITKPA